MDDWLMYPEFLDAVSTYIKALNTASKSIDESHGMTPYVGRVEIKYDGHVLGFLEDETGDGNFGFGWKPVEEPS